MTVVGSHLVVSNAAAGKLTVYRKLTGTHEHVIGGRKGMFGKGLFKAPTALCCSPNETVFIADGRARRVHEVTVAGELVRSVGNSGQVGPHVGGVATDGTLLAVAGDGNVALFDVATGAFVRRFGEMGRREGQLGVCAGVRLSPGAARCVVVAEEHPVSRLSLFDLNGAFLRCLGVGTLSHPRDLEFTSTGDVAVADGDGAGTVFVLQWASGDMMRRWDTAGGGEGEGGQPLAMASSGGKLYVLLTSARVQVFE